MKKKYCAPLIKEVLFKADETVSACIINPYTGRIIQDVTPEDDYLTTRDVWIRSNDGSWWKRPETWGELIAALITWNDHIYTDYKTYLERPNHS